MSTYDLFRQSLVTVASGSFESDEELVWRATHDVEAFQELCQRYNLPVYRYHIAFTGNEQAAQNLTSQTFIEAYASITAYRFGGRFIKRLFRMANDIRRNHFHKWGGSFPGDAQLDIPGNGFVHETGAAFQVEIRKIAWAIDKLTCDMAEALALRIFAGLNVSDVGQIMVKSDAVVKMLVYRGLNELKVRLSMKMEYQND